MKVAFLLYPTAQVKVNEDSSFWIMRELKRRGHQVTYFQSHELSWRDGSPHAYLTPARLDDRHGFLSSPTPPQLRDLASLDCVFIRKEPPFKNDYLYALQLLELIKRKVLVVNDPRGIALCNEKLFTLAFKKHIPETLVTEDAQEAAKFVRDLARKVVVKPLDNKAGTGIFFTFPGDKNMPSLLEMATRGRQRILLQRFISPGLGDRRLLVLNGKLLGTFRRRPPASDFRANLSVGATLHKSPVLASDHALVEAMAPALETNGLWFAGIDVIGKYLTEINVTSPSGIPEINGLNKTRVEKQVVDFLELKRPLLK